MHKVSFLILTINNGNSIFETINSVVKQTYTNWEIIIIDDGSCVEIQKNINEYIKQNKLDDKIKYVHKGKKDELFAIMKKFINGDYVFILNSNDLLYGDYTLMQMVLALDTDPNIDGIIGNFDYVDEKSNLVKMKKSLPYINKKRIPVIQLLLYGKNLYDNIAFYRKDIFLDKVYSNFVIWNYPFWLNIENNKIEFLNFKNVDFKFLQHRLCEENYNSKEMYKFCSLMGQLRTITQLMGSYNIPFFKFQYYCLKIFMSFNMFKYFHPIYQRKEFRKKEKIIKYIISINNPDGYTNNIFLNSLIKFHKNRKKRCINFDSIYNGEKIYKGNESSLFNQKILNNELEDFYIIFMSEMCCGFDEIYVSKKNLKKVEDLLEFLCIFPFVSIRCSERLINKSVKVVKK